MEKYTIEKLKEHYDFDFEKALNEINKKDINLILLQFPDGLKPYATNIVDYLRKKTKNKEFLIYFGSCYGACDTPIGFENLGVNLLIQFGHNALQPNYLKN